MSLLVISFDEQQEQTTEQALCPSNVLPSVIKHLMIGMCDNADGFAEQITNRIVDLINVILRINHFQDLKDLFEGTEAVSVFSSQEYDIGFNLTGNDLEDFSKLVDYMVRARRWKNHLSSKYVGKRVEDVFYKSLSRIREASRTSTFPHSLSKDCIEIVRNNVRELFAEFDLESAREWGVYVPLAGIDLTATESSSLEIGNVCLKQMNDARMKSLNDKINSIILSSPYPNEDANREAYSIQIRTMLDKFSGEVCAVYHVTAESRKAKEIAEEQTQDILDLLTYFICTRYPKSYGISVGLYGELARSARVTVCVPLAQDGFSIQTDIARRYTPLQLTSENIEQMKLRGIFHVANILKKGERNDFEETLLDGIRWFATSQRQLKKTLEFVTLMTCLENCVTPKGSDPKATAIAEGCAFLLGDTLKSRNSLKADVKYLYRLRSGTLHSGTTERGWENANFDPDICPDFDSCLAKLRGITMALIDVLIQYHGEFGFKSKQDLLDWIEEEKLTPKKKSLHT